MEKELMKMIFIICLKDFSQQNQKEGVGIGLSLAKEIIEKHHGIINVYNNQGAVFELIFPKFLAKRKV